LAAFPRLAGPAITIAGEASDTLNVAMSTLRTITSSP
jgi:hypothetical protein